jgi:hypothetical protein
MTHHHKFLAMLESEFSRYLGDHPTVGERIPANALIVFQVESEPAFNTWHKQLSLQHREGAQPVVEIHVGRFRTDSLIEQLELVPA